MGVLGVTQWWLHGCELESRVVGGRGEGGVWCWACDLGVTGVAGTRASGDQYRRGAAWRAIP